MKKYIVEDAAKTGGLIRENRTKIKLTLAELAAAVGVALGSIQQWESGRRSVSPRFIPRLLAILKVSAADLAITEMEITPEESPWHDPGEIPPPTGEEVLIIARTENYDAGKLLAIFDPDCGWILTDAEYEWFEVRAWMEIPEWKGGGNE